MKDREGFENFIRERQIDRSIDEELQIRNLKRIINLKRNDPVYCPMLKRTLEPREFMGSCHMTCPYGHMARCHYPFDHESIYCHHDYGGNQEKRRPPEKLSDLECPWCGRSYENPLNPYLKTLEGYVKIIKIYNGESVESVFPEMSPVKREQLITNYCEECQNKIFFERIKALKKRKPPSSMGFWERLMWGNLRHILVGRRALKHKQDEVSEQDHIQYLKTSVSEYIKCRKKYLEKEAGD